jgi:AcrR family transcriptional regulator
MLASRRGQKQKSIRRTQEERSEKSRAELLQSAVDTIAELGLANATIATIAKRANLTAGAVQHHFGTRDPLLLAILDDFGRRLSEIVARPLLSQGKPVSDRITLLLDETWNLFEQGHFIAVTEILLSSRSDPKFHRIVSARTSAIAAMMDKRWLNVFVDVKIKPQQIAVVRRLAQAAMRGLALRSTFFEPHADLAAERDLLREVVISALQPKPPKVGNQG